MRGIFDIPRNSFFQNYPRQMTPNEVIYHLQQSRELSEIWKQFTRAEKEEVLKKMQNKQAIDLHKTLIEVKTGQNRLF